MSQPLKVMYAYPPLSGKGSPMITQNRQFQWYSVPSFIYPVVPAQGATLLRDAGYDVFWEDNAAQQEAPEIFWKRLRQVRPDLIAMESKTPVIKQHWEITKRIKDELPDCKVALMGDHVTALPEESLQQSPADYAITGGHYDFMVKSIADHLDHGAPLGEGIYYSDDGVIRKTPPWKGKLDLDSLPLIDRHLTKAHLYGEKWRRAETLYYTMFGRDCAWGKCTFCSWTTTYPTFNTQSVERALDEVGHLIEHYGAKEVFDDSGTIPGGTWLTRFCEGMIERGYHEKIMISCNIRFDMFADPEVPRLMKRAGFRKVKAGLESASQQTLDRLDKGISPEQIRVGSRHASEAGLDVHLTVMVGFPWESHEDVRRTVEFSRSLMRDGYAEMLQSTVTVPYPGTPLYQEAIDNDWLTVAPDDYDRFDQRGSVMKSPLTSEEIVDACNQIYRSFLTPRYVLRQVAKNLHDPGYLMRGAKSVLGHLLDFRPDREART